MNKFIVVTEMTMAKEDPRGRKLFTFSLDKLDFAKEEKHTYYPERNKLVTINYSLLTVAGKEVMVVEKLEDFLPKEWVEQITAYKVMKELSE